MAYRMTYQEYRRFSTRQTQIAFYQMFVKLYFIDCLEKRCNNINSQERRHQKPKTLSSNKSTVSLNKSAHK